jgi:hypothetical protein
MSDLTLTPEQETEALRVAELAAEKTKAEILYMARLLVSKKEAKGRQCELTRP